MLTLFTTAKPFEGHSGVIQRNALKSWKLLHPDIEIILFGDDAGGAEIANELGLRHEPKPFFAGRWVLNRFLQFPSLKKQPPTARRIPGKLF